MWAGESQRTFRRKCNLHLHADFLVSAAPNMGDAFLWNVCNFAGKIVKRAANEGVLSTLQPWRCRRYVLLNVDLLLPKPSWSRQQAGQCFALYSFGFLLSSIFSNEYWSYMFFRNVDFLPKLSWSRQQAEQCFTLYSFGFLFSSIFIN